jgi:hypothetical protein
MLKMKTVLGMILALTLPLAAFAGGAQEPTSSGTTSYAESSLTLFALAEKANEAETTYIERMTIPSEIALFTWTPFSMKNGELSTEGSAAYAMRSKTLSFTNKSDGLLVLEYHITVALPRAGGSARSSQTVVFSVKDCLDNKGGVLFQPARLAAVRAAGLSRLSSGSLRIATLSYADGRFTAVVEFK